MQEYQEQRIRIWRYSLLLLLNYVLSMCIGILISE